jgi:hypothetical protein
MRDHYMATKWTMLSSSAGRSTPLVMKVSVTTHVTDQALSWSTPRVRFCAAEDGESVGRYGALRSRGVIVEPL